MPIPIVETRIINHRQPYSVIPIASLIIPGPVHMIRTRPDFQLWEPRPNREVWSVACGGVLLAYLRITVNNSLYTQEISLRIPNMSRASANDLDEVIIAGWNFGSGMQLVHDCGAVYEMEIEG